jgi:hypothetical protein
MVSLTMLPLLATAAVAAAEPPGMTAPIDQADEGEPELSPPGMTPYIHELECEEDPNWRLRNDCAPKQISYQGGHVIRGGFGNYFHLSGSGSSGGSHGSHGRGSGGG